MTTAASLLDEARYQADPNDAGYSLSFGERMAWQRLARQLEAAGVTVPDYFAQYQAEHGLGSAK